MAEPRLSVRTSSTLGAVLVVGVVLAVGVLLGARYLQVSLLGETLAVAQARADAVAAQLETGGHLLTVVDLDEDDELVQVLDEDGEVAGASATARGLAALPLDAEQLVVRDEDGEEQAFALATASMDEDATADDLAGGTVVVGRSLDGVRQVQIGATAALVGAAAVLLVLVAVLSRWLAGRALRPVERMREQAEAVSHTRLGVRLSQPGGDDEVARLARTLNAMLDRLDESARAQRRFVSDASHELRTPLAVVRQNAELVLSYPDRVDPADLARGTVDEVDRIQELVAGLLLLARSDEQRLRPVAATVDLDDLLLAEAARVRAAGRVRVDTSAVTAVRVTGDPALLARVVRNLVDNAARHATGTVALVCDALPAPVAGGTDHPGTATGWAALDVVDDGPGVPAADRERVFDRFVRLDDARARDRGGSGLGLGLAIVRELVAVHGGTVQVLDATPTGGGARFRVLLPVSGDVQEP
ncbi:MAG TPA: ATP-binding protein [Cellulomonas sp.]